LLDARKWMDGWITALLGLQHALDLLSVNLVYAMCFTVRLTINNDML